MSEERYYLDDLINDAKEDLKSRFENDELSSEYTEDDIAELVDSSVPIHNYNVLMYAANDLWIGCAETEILAVDGKSTAVNCIAGVIYQQLLEALNSHYEELVEEQKDEEE